MNVPTDIRLIDIRGCWRECFQELIGRHPAPLLGNQTLSRLAHMDVGMLQRFQEIGGSCSREIWNVQEFALLVVHTPDAAEIMIAIRTNGSIRRAVLGAACVVVDDRLIVEVADVERAIGPDPSLDRAKPHITPGDEFRLAHFVRAVAHALRFDHLMVYQVDGRLRGEIAVVPLLRP